MDYTLLAINQELYVGYVGPLAGRRAGLLEHQGNKVLVTNSPRLIEPEKGGFPVTQEFLERWLGKLQLSYFFAWTKVAVESLRRGVLRPGQALVLAGPKNSGKSFLQNLIITPLLGGRSAKPYQFMAGITPFNSHLFAAEHQMIEDDIPLTDIKGRRKFAAHIKQITATDEVLNHAKNKQALTLPVFWRLTISCNDEPENLMIPPPMDESITDKVILFKVNSGSMPLPSVTSEERTALRNALQAELPAFLDFFLDFEIPEEIRGTRYGVKEYHHPDILEVLNALSPEQRLMDIIDACLFQFNLPGPLKGTAVDLERELTDDTCSMRREAGKLFNFHNAAATYLARLVNKEPTRFRQHRTNSKRLWEITPPERNNRFNNLKLSTPGEFGSESHDTPSASSSGDSIRGDTPGTVHSGNPWTSPL